MAALLRGKIYLENEEGKGSTFSLMIPEKYNELYEMNTIELSEGEDPDNSLEGEDFIENKNKIVSRIKKPLSLIMGDIDFFKLLNGNYGHLKGDECLREVAKVLNSNIKLPMDFVARYGGEEFIIVLPETNSKGLL